MFTIDATGSGDGSLYRYSDQQGGGSGDGSLVCRDGHVGFGPTAWAAGHGYGISTWQASGFEDGGGFGLAFYWNDRWGSGHGQGHAWPDQRRRLRSRAHF